MVAGISKDQAAAFAVLRRPQVAGDQLPEDRWPALEGGMIGRLGLNPALARRVTTEAGDVWVIPGNGFICHLDENGMGCNSTQVAVAKGLVGWGSARPHEKTIVSGVVPDGVEQVTLISKRGTTKVAGVHDNVYGALLDGFLTSIRFSGPTGEVVLGPWA